MRAGVSEVGAGTVENLCRDSVGCGRCYHPWAITATIYMATQAGCANYDP